MTIDLLVGTNGNPQHLQPFLESVFSQMLLPDRVIVLLYPAVTQTEETKVQQIVSGIVPQEHQQRLTLLSHLHDDYIPGRGVSFDRHYLITKSTSDFIYMIDVDNIFDADLFEKTVSTYQQIQSALHKDCIVAPLVLRGMTEEIQSRGITGFRYRWPKYKGVQGFAYPVLHRNPTVQDFQEPRTPVLMMGANALFGPRHIFQEIQFDPELNVCGEDVDFTARCVKAGYPLVVMNHIGTHHMEPERTGLEHLILATPTKAYYRARNRAIFVKKTATRWQRLQYFCCGYRIQTVRFLLAILVYGNHQRWALTKAVLQ